MRRLPNARSRGRSTAPALLLALASAGVAVADDAPKPAAEAPKIAFSVVLSDLEPVRDRAATRNAELFFAALRGEWKSGRFGARAEARGKDGRFRPYYRGDVWLEEGNAFVETPAGELAVGKLPRAFGPDDETFGGNLFSRNGVTRNPDFGARLSGSARFGWNELAWSAAYLGANDRVAWEEDGRGVESDAGADLRDGLLLRVAYRIDQGIWTVRPGVSLATDRIVGAGEAPELRRNDGALDVTATIGPLALRLQGLRRDGAATDRASFDGRLAYSSAWAALASVRLEFPTVTFHYSYSRWRYQGLGTVERQHQPSVVWSPVKRLDAVIEYSARLLRGPRGARRDDAFRFGLTLKL